MTTDFSFDFSILDNLVSVVFTSVTLDNENNFVESVDNVYVSPMLSRDVRGSNGRFNFSDRKVCVSFKDQSRKPVIGDTYTISGIKYTVLSVEQQDSLAIYICIVRDFIASERLTRTASIQQSKPALDRTDGSTIHHWTTLYPNIPASIMPLKLSREEKRGTLALVGQYKMVFDSTFKYTFGSGEYRIQIDDEYYQIIEWENPESIFELPYFILEKYHEN